MVPAGSNPIDVLVASAKAGNGKAFTDLWDLYIDSLRDYIRKWMKNLDDLYVDDICSRSFEKAFRQIDQFDPTKSQFVTWLHSIAKNTALDLTEKDKRMRMALVSLESSKDVIEDKETESPLDAIIRTESNAKTERYIERLPELYREVASKRLLDGLHYKEIAQEMDMELNTVRTRIRRAKEMMDRMRKEDEQED
ncbi:MAG: RNA polymerase sigma factor [Bacteroidales bacterium]|nr:RNA polymerase sigma factor [Bacteroidales bacterium]